MKYLIILLVFFSSCIQLQKEEKYLIIGDEKYQIIKANDSCEYYTIKMTNGYPTKNYYYHYPQCSWCKKHK